MSVLIKGMGIPTSPVLFCIHPDGKVFADLEGGWREYQAVPVPEHGRLGDLDAVMELVMQYCPDDDGSCSKADFDLRELLDEIESLPTIIPEDEVV